MQDKAHIPQPDLNAVGIFVPFWFDAVRISLPDDFIPSRLQVIDESSGPPEDGVSIGDKTYIVGYPYGFSVGGQKQPTPVVLTRFISALYAPPRPMDVFLDGAGAPVMSGAAVFVERGDAIHFVGIYSGLIYPDHVIGQAERITALGLFSNLRVHIEGRLQMVQFPDEPIEPQG